MEPHSSHKNCTFCWQYKNCTVFKGQWHNSKQSVWSFRAKDMNSYLQMHGWSPSKLLVDKCIVRVAATHNLRTWNMVNRQSFVLKAEQYLCHLVHAYHLLELQHKDYWFARASHLGPCTWHMERQMQRGTSYYPSGTEGTIDVVESLHSTLHF